LCIHSIKEGFPVKRFTTLTAAAFALLLAFSTAGAAFDEDDVDAPGRSSGGGNWKDKMLSRQLSIGLELAHRLGYSYTDPAGNETEWQPGVNEITWFGGFNFRYFFPKSNWGVGFEGLVLDMETLNSTDTSVTSGYDGYGYYTYIYQTNTETTLIKWLVDIDLLFRFPVTPKLLVNGGVGFTIDVVTWTQKDSNGNELNKGSEVGDVGFNFKIGGEYFLDEVWSVTLDWKWQTWASGIGEESYTIHSIVAGVHLSF